LVVGVTVNGNREDPNINTVRAGNMQLNPVRVMFRASGISACKRGSEPYKSVLRKTSKLVRIEKCPKHANTKTNVTLKVA